jgi:RHS repeat-associated protein
MREVMKVPSHATAASSTSWTATTLDSWVWLLSIAFTVLICSHEAHASATSGAGTATGGGAAAAQESFKTDLFTGSMNTSVPILLPAGANGFHPAIEVAYNSHRGDTWVGRGWDLSFSAIRRVTKNGTPRYDDDPATGDRFAIGDDLMVRADNGYYRSYLENFARIERVDDGDGNVAHWVVHGTDGSTAWFGYTANARIEGPAGRQLAWLLERRIDRMGNFIRYEYYTDGETGGVRARYPKRVAYSFRGDGGEALGSAFPNSDTVRSVQFTLEPRPDPSISFQGGHLVRIKHRLSEVEVRMGSALVTRYDLVYLDQTAQGAPGRHSNRRSLLHQVRQIGADGVSTLPAATYSYTGRRAPAYPTTGTTAQQFAASFNGLDLNESQIAFRDVNGDPAPDFVFTSKSSTASAVQLNRKGAVGQHGFWPALGSDSPAYAVPRLDQDGEVINGTLPTPIAVRGLGNHWVDYTGDGKPDLVTGRRQVFSVMDSPFVNETVMCPNPNFPGYRRPSPLEPLEPEPEQVPCESLDQGWQYSYRNVGWRWVLENYLPDQPTATDEPTATLPARNGYRLLPTRLATIMQCGTWKFISATQLQLEWVPIVMGMTQLIDVNGDGLADFLEHRIPDPRSISCDQFVSQFQNNQAAWRAQFTERNVYLNTGDGWQFPADPAWSARFSAAIDSMQALLGQLMVFDINGDGLADFGPDTNGNALVDDAARIFLGSGNVETGWVQATSTGFTNIPIGYHPVDIDGDGLADHVKDGIVRFNTGSSFVQRSADWVQPSWMNGLGSQDLVVDLDGDGVVDHVRSNGTSTTAHMSSDGDTTGAAIRPEGLLDAIQLPSGGRVVVDYASSAQGSCLDTVSGGCHASPVVWPVDQIPGCSAPFAQATASAEAGAEPTPGGDLCAFFVENLPFSVQTIVSTTTNDGNRNIRIDRIAYDGGAYSPSTREQRGFGRVTESPQILTYPNPITAATEKVDASRVTLFYQKDFLRGQPAIQSAFGMVNGVLSLLEVNVGKYFVTRADLDKTFVLQGLNFRLACDVAQPGQIAECDDFVDIQTLDLSFLPATLPFDRFQAGFGPDNRDDDRAFLVLDAGETQLVYDGDATPVQIEQTRFHDPYGNVQFTLDLGDIADDTDNAAQISTYAEDVCYQGAPAGSGECFASTLPRNLHNLPGSNNTFSFQESGASLHLRLVALETLNYDGLSNGYTTVGNLTRTTSGLGASLQIVDYEYASGHFGRPHRVSDPHRAGEATVFTEFGLDAAQSFVTTQRHAGVLFSTRTYDPPGAPPGLGLLYTEVDENGAWVAQGADPFGRPTCSTRVFPEGTTPPSGGDACALPIVGQTVYDDFVGFDPGRAARTTTLFDGQGNSATTWTYQDGFARTIRVERDGLLPDGAGGETPATIVTTVGYDLLGRVETRSRPFPLGSAPIPGVTTRYDERNRPRFEILPNGGVAETEYHKLETTGHDAEGRTRITLRDGRGRRVAVTEMNGAASYDTAYLYDPAGRLRGICDAEATSCPVIDCTVGTCNAVGGDLRHSTRIQYDLAGQRIRLDDPDLGVSTFGYDGAGRLTAMTDANGVTLTSVYDGRGRLRCENPTGVASCLPADGADVFYTYGDDPGAPPASHGANRPVRIQTPLATYFYVYDAEGRVGSARMVLADGTGNYLRSWTYDWVGRPLSASYPDGEIVQRRYDVMGIDRVWSAERVYVDDVIHNAELQPTQVAYGNGAQRELAYEPDSGFVDRIYDHRGASPILDRRFDYDLTGKITTATDAVRPEESLSGVVYDGLGRLERYRRGSGPLQTNVYDPLGNLVWKEGTPIPYQHPTKPHAPFDATNPDRFGYDARGNRTRRNGRTLDYDARNRLVAVSGELPSQYAYDFAGERSEARYGADRSVFFGLDLQIQNGVRFVKTLDAGGATVARVATVPFGGGAAAQAVKDQVAGSTLLGSLAAAELAGLVLLQGTLLVWRRRQALPLGRAVPAGALATLLVFAPTSLALAETSNGDLNRDGRVDVADVVIMQRLLAREFAPTPTQAEAADVAPLTPGPDGELTVGDGVLLLRAAAGEDVDGDGLDGEAEAAAGTNPFSTDTDGDGLSDAEELALGTDPATAVDTDQDGLSDAMEVELGTNPLLADTDGDGIVDGRDAQPLVLNPEAVHYVHTDHLGGVAVLTNVAGAIVREIAYGIWGDERRNEPTPGAPASTPNPELGFTGQQPDRATGLVYYGARWYDPEVGSFSQPDPIVAAVFNPQSLNRFAYVLGDPLNRIDPTGNFSFGGVFGGIGNFFGRIGGALRNFGLGLLGGLKAFGGALLASTMSFASRMLDQAQRFVDQARSAVRQLRQWPGTAVQAVVGAATTSFGAVQSGVKALGRKLGLVKEEDDEEMNDEGVAGGIIIFSSEVPFRKQGTATSGGAVNADIPNASRGIGVTIRQTDGNGVIAEVSVIEPRPGGGTLRDDFELRIPPSFFGERRSRFAVIEPLGREVQRDVRIEVRIKTGNADVVIEGPQRRLGVFPDLGNIASLR